MQETRILLRNVGKINPVDAKEYMGQGGYAGLKKAISMDSADILKEVKESGLKGRGGAGFPTGLKWQFVYNMRDEQKYIVCNADEGEPGTNKDRILLSEDPNSVFEGMLIAGKAVGANKGYIYLRAEYPYIFPILEEALDNARAEGCLGENIFGSGFDFDIELRSGGGAYVCGEETALLESIEGKRGEPRFRPPYPGVKGLFDKPTVINNVETFANVGPIMEKGAAWYRTIGTENSPGTKLYTLSGNLKNRGVYEFPMGVNLKDLIYEVGGGIEGGKNLLAVQTGGSSGAIINADQIDMPMEAGFVASSGGSLGAGDVLVIDDSHCIIDILENVLVFFSHESCGKCTPCREGGFRLLQLVRKFKDGTAKAEDIDTIRDLSETMKLASLCGLGQATPVPVLTCLDNFEAAFQDALNGESCCCCQERRQS